VQGAGPSEFRLETTLRPKVASSDLGTHWPSRVGGGERLWVPS